MSMYFKPRTCLYFWMDLKWAMAKRVVPWKIQSSRRRIPGEH